jgi:mono/diheme cytochrome c family protein
MCCCALHTGELSKHLCDRTSRQGTFIAGLSILLTALAVLITAMTVSASIAHAQKEAQPDWQGKVDYWQPQWMQRELWGPGRMPKGMQVRMLRHWTYVNHGVPKVYEGATQALAKTAENLLAGAQGYQKHCASCHGVKGLGDGDASKSLLPSPALLAYMIKRPVSADEYLLWAISEGGDEFKTAMPGFKDKLNRDEIWQIIAFMRNGFKADAP